MQSVQHFFECRGSGGIFGVNVGAQNGEVFRVLFSRLRDRLCDFQRGRTEGCFELMQGATVCIELVDSAQGFFDEGFRLIGVCLE